MIRLHESMHNPSRRIKDKAVQFQRGKRLCMYRVSCNMYYRDIMIRLYLSDEQ